MVQKKSNSQSFIKLIVSTKFPKIALTIGLIASVLTTLAGLVVPFLTKELVDGFSVAALSFPLVVGIGVAFIA